jgi:glyoxylase-like metal-dependent hydrolase (beta-lactamase superfamily II)
MVRHGSAARSYNRAVNTKLATVVLLLGLLSCTDEPAGSSASATNGSTSSGAGGMAAGGSGQGAGVSTGGGDVGGSGGSAPSNNGFPPKWNDGTNCGQEPDVQVWAYAGDTYILRQSLCSNYEAPFIYLFLGQDMAFVQDTGTGAVNLFAEIDALVQSWAGSIGKANFPVVVTHSHGHGDHVGGDNQFQNQSGYTVVGSGSSAVINYFMFANWPTDVTSLDLGGRVLDVLGIPGHQAAHVAIYDRRHDLLLTGDHLYPGRLYINNWNDYKASTQRLVDFVTADHPVQWVLGTHIELSALGFDNDFNIGSQQHPNEHVLQLDVADLIELNEAVKAMGNTPSYQPHENFIIYP